MEHLRNFRQHFAFLDLDHSLDSLPQLHDFLLLVRSANKHFCKFHFVFLPRGICRSESHNNRPQFLSYCFHAKK